uniref:Uncharacterized protein n=1 Tax=Anguilla anguilla TaxID=7936 RepID=A0A0E9SWZ4_ANGAN
MELNELYLFVLYLAYAFTDGVVGQSITFKYLF